MICLFANLFLKADRSADYSLTPYARCFAQILCTLHDVAPDFRRFAILNS
jgi:hypothetical protein